MATCKDCLSYDVCKELQGYQRKMDYSQLMNIEDICNSFKSKSHYVEIPCKLGDTVCMRWSWEPVRIRNRITKGTVIGIYIGQNKKPTLTIKHNDHDFRYYRGKFIVEEVLDGERVYLERSADNG